MAITYEKWVSKHKKFLKENFLKEKEHELESELRNFLLEEQNKCFKKPIKKLSKQTETYIKQTESENKLKDLLEGLFEELEFNINEIISLQLTIIRNRHKRFTFYLKSLSGNKNNFEQNIAKSIRLFLLIKIKVLQELSQSATLAEFYKNLIVCLNTSIAKDDQFPQELTAVIINEFLKLAARKNIFSHTTTHDMDVFIREVISVDAIPINENLSEIIEAELYASEAQLQLESKDKCKFTIIEIINDTVNSQYCSQNQESSGYQELPEDEKKRIVTERIVNALKQRNKKINEQIEQVKMNIEELQQNYNYNSNNRVQNPLNKINNIIKFLEKNSKDLIKDIDANKPIIIFYKMQYLNCLKEAIKLAKETPTEDQKIDELFQNARYSNLLNLHLHWLPRVITGTAIPVMFKPKTAAVKTVESLAEEVEVSNDKTRYRIN